MFDRIVIVDWSAANHRKLGKDSIWICQHGTDPVNLGTRAEAKAHLQKLLKDASERGERTLIGFDFPFGYQVGFADRLGLETDRPWQAVWDEIARLVKDDPDNRNNRFCVGTEFNRRISGEQFPFWGCPVRFKSAYLSSTHHRRHTTDPLKEHRLIDFWMTGAQPCWKLAYTGSVGSQALTGIPVVWALRNDPRWAIQARIWPFETGLQLPGDAAIVFAEVWPSWWNWKASKIPGEIADRTQVRHVARLFAECDRSGELRAWFRPPVPPDGVADVLREEAWTLGVMAPRPRKASRQTPASI